MKIYRSIELGAAELSEKLEHAADVKIQFDPIDENELAKSDFDLIELSEEQSQLILSKTSLLDWQIQSTAAADAFIVDQKKLKPIHLSSVAFVNFLQSKHITLDTAKNAVLVGNYSFLITYGVALAKIGFNKIYLISPDHISYKEKIAETQKSLFNVQIQQLNLDDMTGISELASLLVIDFDLSEFPDMVETLTYFNFVTENAVFFDLQNYRNDTLSSEAEKASLRVLDSAEFHLHKYRLFQKNLNNRS
jgi:hypothetical protein